MMTNSKAIEIFEKNKPTGPRKCDQELAEACDAAISALTKVDIIENDIDNFSDGYHTFSDLYYQRLILFATIVNSHKDISWKTHWHDDGEKCFGGGWFLVAIDTPAGTYGYHYEDKYWDLFNCDALPKAKHWDGYTDKDVVRLLSLLCK